MATNDWHEKRKYVRVKLTGELTIYHVKPSLSGNIFEVLAKPMVVQLDDISENGIKLEVRGEKLPSDILKINFKLNQQDLIDGYAQKVWEKDNKCGLQFIILNKSSKQRIKNYVAQQTNVFRQTSA